MTANQADVEQLAGPSGLAYLDAAALGALVDAAGAVPVLARALRGGLIDPEEDGPRLFAPAGRGREFLMMPAQAGGMAGVKVVSSAPGNPAQGRPAVQGVYVLFESEYLCPVAVLDAAELTLVRTPATTVLAARFLLAGKRGLAASDLVEGGSADGTAAVRASRVVVFGTGPQADRHITCLNAVLRPDDIAVVGRRPEAVLGVVERAAADGAPTRPADADPSGDLRRADLVVCVTGSPSPLFDAGLVSPDAVVCAVGVHGPDKRELAPELVLGADVVVEGRASALRESGNLLGARPAHEWLAEGERGRPLANLADLVAGRFTPSSGRPAVFSGVGMAWEDLVVAAHAYARQAAVSTRS